MSKFTDKRKFNNRIPKKPLVFPGRLGDGSGNVAVSGMDNYVYCRVGDKVEVVYNDRMPLINDMAVDVGRDTTNPDKFQVLGSRSYAPGGSSPIQVGYAPARRYEWMAPDGGQDPVYIHNRAIKYLRLGPYSGMTIEVQSGFIWTTAPKYISRQTASMAAHIPATTGKAALVLITLNTSGTLVATKGSEFTLADMTTPALMLANIPAIPASTAYVTGAVRVYYGQTAVSEGRVATDIIDLRFTGINTAATSISAHASTHISTGSDPIADAVAGGASGLMTGAMLTKLNGIATGATKGITVKESDGAPDVANVTSITVTNGTLTDNGSGSVTITTGGGGGSLTVEEIDGSPSVANVNTIKFSNGSVTDNTGGVVTVTTGGGGGGHVIQDNSTPLTQRTNLNLIGFTVADNSGADATDVTSGGAAIGHIHDTTDGTAKLSQANTHQSPDTDTATTSLHHTLGSGANQAAAGNHTHTLIVHAQAVFTIESNPSTTGVKPFRIYIPYVGTGATIEEVFLVVNTAPSGNTLQIDVHKNGASIFNATQYVELDIGAYTATKSTDFASTSLAKDDYFQIEVVQASSSAEYLTVHIRYKWTLTGS